MSWPAKYFTAHCSIEELAQHLQHYFAKGSLTVGSDDDPNLAKGFHGLDHYFGFWLRNTAGQVMVDVDDDDPEVLRIIVYAVPGAFGRTKAVEILNNLAAAVPGSQSLPFPGGNKAGDLLFV